MQTLEEKVKWAEREDRGRDPLNFFREKYPDGVTRARLARQDFSLYRILHRRNLLDRAIPEFDTKTAQRMRLVGRANGGFGDDPLGFYRQHYPGLTRGQLGKKAPGLYERLMMDGLLGEVPVTTAFGGNPLKFYRLHYPGMTRGRLQGKYRSLYERLRKDGLLDEVPLMLRDFGDDPLAYYREHYSGMTRGRLEKEDPSLYGRLRMDGLLDEVPLKLRK